MPERSTRLDYPEAVWAEVESSWIKALSFVDAFELPMREGVSEQHRVGTLLLETRQNQVYEYRDVHYAVVRALCLAASPGTAFHVLMSHYTPREGIQAR